MQRFAGQSVSGWISIVVAAALSMLRPASAACVPPGTPGDDQIVCTDVDTAGVQGKGGNDTVDVAQDAAIRIDVSGAAADVVGMDAGAGDDRVSNAGSITVDAASLLQPTIVFPSLPEAIWNIASTADVIALGVAGGTGRDSFLNFATLGVTAIAQVGSVAVVGTLDDVGTVLAASTASARATGAGGAGAVDFVNGDLIRTSASATADALSVSVSLHGGADPVWMGGTISSADATGLAGAASADSLENLGSLVVNAMAQSRSFDAALALQGFVAAATSSTAGAHSAGILGAAGDDVLGNSGAITVESTASGQGVSVGLGVDVAVRGDAVGATLANASVDATAGTVAIAAGDGRDVVRNAGRIAAVATAAGMAAGASVNVSVAPQGSVEGAALSDAHVTATAAAQGIDGATGADDIESHDVEVSAAATATGVAASIAVAGSVTGAPSGKALSDASVEADATTVGIAAGDADDTVVSDGRIGSAATAVATGVGVSLPVTISRDGKAQGSALSDVSVEATAQGSAIDGGSGNDRVDTRGQIDTTATARATGVAVALTISGSVQGGASGEALSDTSVRAASGVTGVASGDGTDDVENRAALTATATATGTGVSVAGSVSLAKEADASGAALSDASVTATATATGIDAGSDASGDVLENAGSADLRADATATGVAVALTVAGTAKGDAAGSALSKSAVLAESALTGIAGHGGNDRVTNAARLAGTSIATATGVSAGVKVGFTRDGAVAPDASAEGGAMSDASSRANARATGIDGGGGTDTLDNDGELALTSTAKAVGVAASLDVAGTAKGDAKGTALSDASATADAVTHGIFAGDGADTVTNSQRIGAAAVATGLGVSVSVPVAITREGGATGSSLSDASVTATAAAAGIDGGRDGSRDVVTNEGEIASGATATATGVAASVTVAGTAKGDVAGSALSESSVVAGSTAVGIATHDGNDQLTNTARVGADAASTANGVSASVKVGFTKEGNVAADATAEGAALSDASSDARAQAVGLDSGSGADALDNRGALEVSATSNALGVAASLDVAGTAKGDAKGAALSDSSVTAEAAARGIAAGDGVDAIDNAARIATTATATGVGVSASIPVAISKEGGAEGSALSKTSVTADAATAGIDAGSDASGDTVVNGGEIVAVGTANATGVAAAVTVAGTAKGDAGGKALSDSSVAATATVNGVTGGAGVDALTNTGAVTSNATSTATGVSASVRVGFTKEGDVAADAEAEGTALSNASVRSEARAVGIDAGTGADRIRNRGDLTARGSATATGVAASIDVAGSAKGDVAGGALADASVTSTATAMGIEAGEGNDDVGNENTIIGDVMARAIGAAAGVSVSITKEGSAKGAAISNAAATAAALVTGIDGGEGDDRIDNSGAIRLQHPNGSSDGIEADAKAIAASVSVAGSAEGEVTAKALADASARAEASAAGIAAGAGADTITNSGGIVADMDATALTVAASVGVAVTVDSSETPDAANATASALSDASATATASSRGIDTGSGTNKVTNTGVLDLSSTAAATSVAVSVSVGGTANGDASADALSDASSTAQARSVGVAGGVDRDELDNRERIAARADATATTVGASLGVAITLDGDAKGSSLSDSRADAAAAAIGLDGGEGANTLENAAAIVATAASSATSVAVALTVAGTAEGDAEGSALAKASSSAESASTAIRAGAGLDSITNRAAIEVDAVAAARTVAVGAGVSLSLGGSADNAALSDASSTARATATAIDAGDGNDIVTNEAAIVLMPAAPNTNDVEASAESVAVSVTVDGALGGDTKSKALSNASAVAEARATGIAAGAGDDKVTNTGTMTGAIDARAKSVAAAVGVTVSVGGSSQGSAVSDASSTARARAYGIGGGDGADEIGNAGRITLGTGATADGVSLSVKLGGALGTSDQSALANTRVTADASTIALDGGSGRDRIANSGDITVGATSVLEGKSFAVNVSLLSAGLTAQSAVADVSGIASAAAAAIAGGDGADYVRNTAANLDVTATSTARTSAYTITLSGLSVGAGVKESASDATTRAVSDATGIAGGEGADDVGTGGKTRVLARSTSEGYATTRNITIVNIGGDLQDAAAKSTTTAQSVARGLDGGGADDRLAASGELDIDAEATVTGAATAANVSGASIGATAQKSVAKAGTVADAQAVGIDGGAGGNIIDNAAAITVDAVSSGSTTSVSAGVTGFNLAGATFQDAAADASSTIGAHGFGLRGGEGTDDIDNRGTLTVKASSTGNVVSRAEVESLTFIGGAKGKAAADASSLIAASAAGIDAGAGDDLIASAGTIIVDAIAIGTTHASSAAKSKVVFGSASAKSATSAAGAVEATATGIAGGAGRDDIGSSALVDVGAAATLTVTASSVSIASSTFGSAYAAAAADSSSSTRSAGTGIDGGDDADEIRNEGGVVVDIHATTTVNQTTAAITSSTFGSENSVANSNAAASADAAATGIAGGGGNDHVVSPASVSALAEGTVTMQVLTLSSDGPATADARTEARASAVGIDGGAGDDTIEALGDVTAMAIGTVGSGSRTGGDNVDEDVRITVSTRAAGIAGGAGNDGITSAGTMLVTADSNLDSNTVTFAGLAVLKSRLTADATAVGVDGGEGSDTLASSTALTVRATADVSSKQSSYTFGGGEGTSFLQGQSSSMAFSAAGGLAVVSTQNVSSTAVSTVTTEDATISFSGRVTKELRGRALSTATGLQGGMLADGLENRAVLSVSGTSTVSSTGKVDITYDKGTDQQMRFEALANALGVASGAGDDGIVNALAGTMTIDAVAGATVEGVTASCDGIFGCGFGSWNTRKTFNWADALAEASAIGLDLGDGSDTADNAGSLAVRADARANARAISDVDFSNASEAYADGTARAIAWGVQGAGADQALNRDTGSIAVTATAEADAAAQGGKIGGTDVDLQSSVSEAAAALSTTFVDATQKNAAADDFVGKWVRFLSGANADAYALVTAFDPATGKFTLDTAMVGAIAKDDRYTVSEARNATSGAFANATATGIELRGGDAIVVNDGVLSVSASATADNDTVVYGGTAAFSASAIATARGVVTGDGNDRVRNGGSITVFANADARLMFTAPGDMTASATAIDTGAGDDLIVNEGTITATTQVSGLVGLPVTRLATAVKAGAGNDHLMLGATSVTRGFVFLDEGDDRLTLRGNASVVTLDGTPGTVNGGPGFDTVVFDGAGLSRAGLVSFEGVTKQGGGTFTVPALPTMQRLELIEGALETDSGYVFAPGGEFRTWVYGEHGNGTLLVNNGNASLGGDLIVTKGHGAYVDGSTYTVLRTTSGGAVLGSFNQVVLPQPTALVSFAFDQKPDALQVRALVGSFDIVAGNDLERAMAGYLDRILPTARGELSDVLGQLQSLPAAQAGAAMASLSPGYFESTTRSSLGVAGQYARTLERHLAGLRGSGLPGAGGIGAYLPSGAGQQPVFLAYNDLAANTDAGVGGTVGRLAQLSSAKRHGIWLDSFGQWGKQDAIAGFSGLKYDMAGMTLGVDYAFSDHFIGGIGGFMTRTRTDSSNGTADGNTDSGGASLYGTWFSGPWYVDGLISYARQNYDNTRRINVGGTPLTATSSHGGDVASAFLGGGYDVKRGDWVFGPFASLQYSYLEEDDFQETGAGSLNLHVDARNTDALMAQAGVRVARIIEYGRGRFVPEARVAWNHDFDTGDRVVRASFAGASGAAFSIPGAPVTSTGATFGAGLTYVHQSGFSTSLQFNAEVRDGYEAYGVLGYVRLAF